MLRCEVCDFTTAEGSSYAGLPPNYQNRVSFYPAFHGTYCKTCASHMTTTLYTLEENDPD